MEVGRLINTRRTIDRTAMPIGHALSLVALSAGAGAVSGHLSALGMGAGFMAEFGAFFGAGVGLLFAPAIIWAAWHESTVKAAAVIVPPTALAAWVGGLLTPPNGGPFLAMGFSVFVYVVASYLFGLWSRTFRLRVRRILENACLQCGYSLRGLTRDAACPECGAPPSATRAVAG